MGKRRRGQVKSQNQYGCQRTYKNPYCKPRIGLASNL